MQISTVRSRLYWWNDNPPPNGYDQDQYSRGADGQQYRNDCSGYISMLAGLSGSPNTGMLVGEAFSAPIAKSDLQFGDILIAVASAGHSSGHVVMFDHWTDATRTYYYGHDFGYGSAPHHTTHVYPYEPDGRSFNPRRLLVINHAEAPNPVPPTPPEEDDMQDADWTRLDKMLDTKLAAATKGLVTTGTAFTVSDPLAKPPAPHSVNLEGALSLAVGYAGQAARNTAGLSTTAIAAAVRKVIPATSAATAQQVAEATVAELAKELSS